jgi:endoglucanase
MLRRMRTLTRSLAPAAGALLLLAAAATAQAADSAATYVRVNQLGYLPAARKVAVVCSTAPRRIPQFFVVDDSGRVVLGPRPAVASGAFAGCAETHRLDFSALRRDGAYRVVAGGTSSPRFRVGADVYDGAADTLLAYMRQQRSGFNPYFKDSVHKKDGIVVDDSVRGGRFVPVSGGWADAADYLQYVTTSANATYVMLLAHRDFPRASGDRFRADGLPGANGVPDVLDEARHGLEWLLRMFPADDSVLYNQLGDDRDHSFWDLPTTDSSDYGWGKGGPRPVYPCTGKPQGLFEAKNRSTGVASTAGKHAAAFALASQLYTRREPAFARTLRERAERAYALGRARPGVCQTAPGRAPYFYEEDNWADDMELAAAELFALTGDRRYLAQAAEYAQREPVTPWMGADTANHYQWYPWYNAGHYALWRGGGAAERSAAVSYYRRGLAAVGARAANGFRMGVPFIWCSNNLIASLGTQAYLYRRMARDSAFVEQEAAALDWLFGTNPWGTSMVIGLPANGVFPRDPHSVVAKEVSLASQTGGLVDGPVYASIFRNLRGIRLLSPDEYAHLNTGRIVYHDDMGDYSTNEPIMDGTANLVYLLSAMARNH